MVLRILTAIKNRRDNEFEGGIKGRKIV